MAAFDLVITDYQMPSLDGAELVRKLRKNGFPGAVVVFSASADETVRSYKLMRLSPKAHPLGCY